MMLARRGRYAEAIVELEPVAEIRPDDYDTRYLLGRCYLGANRPREAYDHLSAAVRLDPQRAGAHVALAGLLERGRRFAEALPHYRRAGELRPDDAAVQLEVGSALARMQQYPEAVVALRSAVELDGSNAEAHRRLGTVLELLGRSDEAREHYAEAQRLAR
jgi:tetratricopeptide (TPR) repeat protein